jgi:hypothetical protein
MPYISCIKSEFFVNHWKGDFHKFFVNHVKGGFHKFFFKDIYFLKLTKLLFLDMV